MTSTVITIKARDRAGHLSTAKTITINWQPQASDPPLLGMSSPQWATDKATSESTGGHIQARRLFYQSFTDSISNAAAEPTYPILSFKTGSFTWAQVASGAADSQLGALGSRLAAMGKPAFMAVHHEPCKQSLGPSQGEGGSAADFAAMTSHWVDVIRAAAPQIDVGVILNGWVWTAGNAHFTDAQLEVWLPQSLRTKLDVIAADDYTDKGGEKGVVRARNRVAWAKRVGSVQATGTGETNGFASSDLTDLFAYAEAEPLYQGGWVCLWNGTAGDYVPVQQTGLMPTWQAIVKGW